MLPEVILRIRSGIYEIPVEIDSSITDAVGDYRWADGAQPKIRVRPGLTLDILQQTVFHELLHHLDESYGIGLGEKRIRALEQLLTDSMQRNQVYWQGLVASLAPQRESRGMPEEVLGDGEGWEARHNGRP